MEIEAQRIINPLGNAQEPRIHAGVATVEVLKLLFGTCLVPVMAGHGLCVAKETPMEKFTTTQSSTAGTDSFVATLPSPHKEAIQGYIAQVQRYQDATAHARTVKTEKIEKGIMDCYLHHHRCFEGKPFKRHTQILRDLLVEEYSLFGLTYPPSLPKIRRVLREHLSRLAEVTSPYV